MTDYNDMPAWVRRYPLPDFATMPQAELWRTASEIAGIPATQIRSPRQRRILRHATFEIDRRANELVASVRADLDALPTTPEPSGLITDAKAWLDAHMPQHSVWD